MPAYFQPPLVNGWHDQPFKSPLFEDVKNR